MERGENNQSQEKIQLTNCTKRRAHNETNMTDEEQTKYLFLLFLFDWVSGLS